MTETPESWDDVGSLRLKVDSVSQKVGLNDWQLQKLRDEMMRIHAQEQEQKKKERFQMKACFVTSIIAAVLFGCVLTLQIVMIWSGSAPKSSQGLLHEAWKPHLEDFKASEVTNITLLLTHTATPRLEVQSALHLQSSADAKGRIQMVTQNTENIFEDLQDKDADDAEDHEDVEQSRDQPGKKNRWSPTIDLRPSLPGDPTEGETHASINATQDKPSSLADHMWPSFASLPFKIMGDKTEEKHSADSHAVFYVCFPPLTFEQNVKKYARVFKEVARRQKPMAYTFCYMDTRVIDIDDDRFCYDLEKISFVLEKSSGESPSDFQFHECSEVYSEYITHTLMKSTQLDSLRPWFSNHASGSFRRTFPQDQEIQVSLIEEFLHDVHSGKLEEALPPKRDLRL
eukprot:gnl/MRDRNA2_/MRDRNA2_141389_c0_seq1.p1 gnl/MRDRNA2_/MRDRNA2_141389_c0~~gnl/MRDRNA2_/MRDRNA2_141389_c0_seq1.p1  ORF type:complete len:399 (-),score=68.03 gnl/MRDRNA2_/MRDRNA2_141389_c0_seq1:126-1322(-)